MPRITGPWVDFLEADVPIYLDSCSRAEGMLIWICTVALFFAPLCAEFLVLTGTAIGVSITAGLMIRCAILPSTPDKVLERSSVFERAIPCDYGYKYYEGTPAGIANEWALSNAQDDDDDDGRSRKRMTESVGSVQM
ncbi:hypothetical protein NpPPO83_00001339 [Neofusicoccum parvum]|uniref:Uncharacterized protein n=1 Tax=Neofusicoccum parvum TaxID=310453 RepID=A0ACB5SBP3_9PEZI|nr:hypothetical protein NpPPO83_00001339 [Neofusicoccum parvum]